MLDVDEDRLAVRRFGMPVISHSFGPTRNLRSFRSPSVCSPCIMIADRYAMKLSAKFARQETEEARLARIARRRVSSDRAEAIRRMLSISGLPAKSAPQESRAGGRGGALLCPDCDRAFALPMHLGRHRKTKHGDAAA